MIPLWTGTRTYSSKEITSLNKGSKPWSIEKDSPYHSVLIIKLSTDKARRKTKQTIHEQWQTACSLNINLHGVHQETDQTIRWTKIGLPPCLPPRQCLSLLPATRIIQQDARAINRGPPRCVIGHHIWSTGLLHLIFKSFHEWFLKAWLNHILRASNI